MVVLPALPPVMRTRNSSVTGPQLALTNEFPILPLYSLPPYTTVVPRAPLKRCLRPYSLTHCGDRSNRYRGPTSLTVWSNFDSFEVYHSILYFHFHEIRAMVWLSDMPTKIYRVVVVCRFSTKHVRLHRNQQALNAFVRRLPATTMRKRRAAPLRQ